MLTDSYGGICPNCSYDRMLVRYGSSGYFQYDACPNCGFNYGNNNYPDDGEMIDRIEFWESESKRLESSLKEKGFSLSMLGILLYIESLPEVKEIISVFDYSNFDWQKMNWKEEK